MAIGVDRAGLAERVRSHAGTRVGVRPAVGTTVAAAALGPDDAASGRLVADLSGRAVRVQPAALQAGLADGVADVIGRVAVGIEAAGLAGHVAGVAAAVGDVVARIRCVSAARGQSKTQHQGGKPKRSHRLELRVTATRCGRETHITGAQAAILSAKRPMRRNASQRGCQSALRPGVGWGRTTHHVEKGRCWKSPPAPPPSASGGAGFFPFSSQECRGDGRRDRFGLRPRADPLPRAAPPHGRLTATGPPSP